MSMFERPGLGLGLGLNGADAPAGARSLTQFLRNAHAIATFFSAFAGFLSLAVLVAAVVGAGWLYRPIPGGAGTHPVTALSTLLLSVGLLRARPIGVRDAVSAFCFGGAIVLPMIMIVEAVLAGRDGPVSTAFAPLVDDPWAEDTPIRMGTNTAVTIILIALAQMLRGRSPQAALPLAILAPVLPFTALMGYSFGLDNFHGLMSPTTLAATFALGMSGLVFFLHYPMLRPLFARTREGRSARLMIIATLVLLWIVGRFMSNSPVGHDTPLEPIYISGMIWFVSVMIVYSAYQKSVGDKAFGADSSSAFRYGGAPNTPRSGFSLRGLFNFGIGAKSGQLNEKIAEAMRDPRGAGVVLVEVSGLDEILRAHDRDALNAVLVPLVRAIRVATRPGDVLVRRSTTSFASVMPGLVLGDAELAAERMRGAFLRLNLPTNVDFSIGVTTSPMTEIGIEQAIGRADHAVGIARANGERQIAIEAYTEA